MNALSGRVALSGRASSSFGCARDRSGAQEAH